jgi:lysozyme
MTEALETLLILLKRFEGCRLMSYRDIVGVWTIAYGETLGIGPGMVWSQDQADSRLRVRAAQFILAVWKMCPTATPNELAAMTSLAYNIGLGAFSASSVRRLHNRGEFGRAMECFALWNKAGGKPVKGLTVRRKVESVYYLLGIGDDVAGRSGIDHLNRTLLLQN